jgi:class 3 adenylate cyclase
VNLVGEQATRHHIPAALGRRHVAVLFVDISGFTRLIETADPETVYEVVSPLLDELALLVRLHGGEVQQILGDGFMAVFGLYTQDGTEAERAVRTALSLVGAGGDGRRPPVHAGVEYGEVLLSAAMEPAGFAVWGRAVNLAKRLCDLAGPRTLYVGPGAHAQMGHGLRGAAPVQTTLKGIARPILAHRITVDGEPFALAG